MSEDNPLPVAAIARTDFHAAIRRNGWNTLRLCAVLVLVGMALGYGLGWALEIYFQVADGYDPSADYNDIARLSDWGLRGGAIMLTASGIWIAVALTRGDRIVLGLAGARLATRSQEPQLHNLVEEMALASGLPKPQVAVIDTPALNAFATGLKPERATIAVTRGLMDELNRSELQGVVAHEMSHIANNDILYATAVGVMVGLIVLVSDAALRSLRFAGRGRSRGNRKGGAALVLVVVLVFALVAPLAARLVQMAISRQREYMADATAVKFTRNPEGLVGALQKIAGSKLPYEGANRAIQHLYISNPLKHFRPGAGALFSTHPAVEERIARLRNLR